MGLCNNYGIISYGHQSNITLNSGDAVISNPSVCDICVVHTTVFGERKLSVVLWFLA